MALPIIENIAALVVSRLQEITTGNGYEFTAESVTRPRRIDRDWTPRNLAIVVHKSNELENSEASCPGNPPRVAYNAIFLIYGFVRESDTASTSPAITENQMASAIKKSIASSSSWHNFGGNAIDAMFTDVETFSDGSPQPFTDIESNGVTVTLNVLYRVSELDPYTAG